MNRSTWKWAALLLLGLVVAVGGCADEDDDEDDNGGDLVFSWDFESMDQVEAAGGYIYSDDPENAFAPGFSGKAFWMSESNAIETSALGRIPPNEGTLEFWVLPKAVWNDGRKRRLLTVGGETNFAIEKDAWKDYLIYTVHGNALSFPVDRDTITFFLFTIRLPYVWTTEWTHIAVTWKDLGARSDNGFRRIYVNGERINEVTGNLAGFRPDAPLLIGSLDPNLQPDALIDELRVYGRAKTDKELLAEVNAVKPRVREDLRIIPEPQPYGQRAGDGFQIDAETVIAVPPEWRDNLDDLLTAFQDAVEKHTGFRPDVVASSAVSGTENVIALGTKDNNGVVRAFAESRKLALSTQNLGRGGYTLEVYSEGVVVAGVQYPGVVYGLTSLLRLVNQFRERPIPPVTVVDRPDFEIRGAEMPGLTGELTDEFERRVRYLAELKITHLFIPGDFYFDLDNEFVREDLQEVFAFVRDHGIEPVPQLSLYGHADRVIAECNALGVDCAEGASSDTCPFIPEMYDDVLTPVLENIAEYLDPRAIHIGHEDIRRFNENPACVQMALSPAELFAYSVNTVRALVRDIIPNARIFAWADMIASMHNGPRLAEPGPGGGDPPNVLDLIPGDITWCPYRKSDLMATIYLFAHTSFKEFGDHGLEFFTAGPSGRGSVQSYVWMRAAFDNGAAGFVGRPGTAENFDHQSWDWLPRRRGARLVLLGPPSTRPSSTTTTKT
ncbi:MAG: hypothetical protein M5R36_06600 [Deltaproteobacteria bacterium]|nr:hypothetical protein [Deltaproteobacteria bacterium]